MAPVAVIGLAKFTIQDYGSAEISDVNGERVKVRERVKDAVASERAPYSANEKS